MKTIKISKFCTA